MQLKIFFEVFFHFLGSNNEICLKEQYFKLSVFTEKYTLGAHAHALFIVSTLPAAKGSLKCNLSPACAIDRILNGRSRNYVYTIFIEPMS